VGVRGILYRPGWLAAQRPGGPAPALRPQTLPGLLDAVTAQFPDRPFVIGEETLSYAGLAARSAGLARGLIARGADRRAGRACPAQRPGEHDGDRVLLAAFGAGLVWGGVVATWGAPRG
jgi:non-ribosomal peptide synthetase component F